MQGIDCTGREMMLSFLYGNTLERGVGEGICVCSQSSWKMNSFYLCSVIPSFLPCYPWATEFPRSDLIFLSHSPASSSTGQPLCLSCFACTPPQHDSAHHPILWAREDLGTVFLLSWPLSLILSRRSPVVPFYCLLFLWAVHHKAWQFRA